ncbi:unnamed protein product [Prunus armeniaca]
MNSNKRDELLFWNFGGDEQLPPVVENVSKYPLTCKKLSHVTLSVSFFEVPLRTLLFISPKIPEQQLLPFVTVHRTSFWAAIASSGHPKRRHGYQKNQHVVLYHPHISAAANRRLDHRKKQEIGRFLPKISIARSGDSEHHFLRSKYDFSTSRVVLAASCVG